MKRMTLFAGALVLLLAVGMVGAASAECEIPADLDPYKDLLAGQDIYVGDVYVWNDATNLCVAYKLSDEAIADGWRITETHLYVGDNVSFPLTKANEKLGEPYFANPIPGKFPYGNDDLGGVEEYIECIPLTELGTEFGKELYIAAHAVVINMKLDETSGVIYGTRTSGGDKGLYKIDVVSGNTELLHGFVKQDVDNGIVTYSNYSNALAFDPANGILYFTAPSAVNVVPSPFRYFELDTGELYISTPENIPGSVVSASWYNGEYYYIAEGEDTLWKINTTNTPEAVFENFDGTDKFTFGDIAISSEGMLYGSTRASPQMFFSLNLNSADGGYTVFAGSNALDLQLAFGSNGKLYGVNHASGKFYEVDVTTGTATLLIIPYQLGFADLASGELMFDVTATESAWGNGTRFNKKGNWGMWFKYSVMCPICCCDEPLDVRFTNPFENVDDTTGWSTTTTQVTLASSFTILNGDATVTGFDGNQNLITQRGLRGLGVLSGEPDEIQGNEYIEVTFDKPYCISSAEVRSLYLVGDNAQILPEQAKVDFYLGEEPVGTLEIVGVGTNNGDDGIATGTFEEAIKMDKMVFYSPVPGDAYNEFAVAGFTVCPYKFEWM